MFSPAWKRLKSTTTSSTCTLKASTTVRSIFIGIYVSEPRKSSRRVIPGRGTSSKSAQPPRVSASSAPESVDVRIPQPASHSFVKSISNRKAQRQGRHCPAVASLTKFTLASSGSLLSSHPHPPFPHIHAFGMPVAQRRGYTNQSGTRKGSGSGVTESTPEKQRNGTSLSSSHEHDHAEHDHDQPHSHSHSIFGHSHSHSEEHSHDAEQIIAAFKGAGDRGSYITLVGLFTNVVLTTAKGLAGWYLHSASLLADAGHSMSDLLGDFVTLFCWRLSRKPSSERYPYGFAKFETFGTTTISILLIGGALGIGFHSYHLLMTALSETASTLPPGQLQQILQFITSTATLPDISLGHDHGHGHSPGTPTVDINAAWFAAMSVLAKEWLYRITKVVADEEKSPVLLANAIHHRSDAYSSLVAFFAILGSWLFPALPLDPLGGLIVSAVILRQGYSLFTDALGDLTDASVSPRTRQSLLKALAPITELQHSGSSAHVRSHTHSNGSSHSLPPVSISDFRARRAGSLLFVDLTARVPGSVSVAQAASLEEKIEHALKTAKKEVKEVRVTFRPLQGSDDKALN